MASFSIRIFFVVCLINSSMIIVSTFMPSMSNLDADPCDTCRKISEKFVQNYKKTAGSNFGGGNTDWEERKLKGYAKSETRLIEIMENTCGNSDGKCSTFLEKYEDIIEDWYQNSSPLTLDQFDQWFCIDTAKVCCSEGTFGKNCRRCQYGDNGRVCSGNGHCDGDGKRSGNGRCVCDTKYVGTNCSRCQTGYTKSVDENNNVICSDIDECQSNGFLSSPCLLYKCNNTEGGYECYGEPFYRDVPKITALTVIFLTAVYLTTKNMYGLATFVLTIGCVLIVLFVKHLV